MANNTLAGPRGPRRLRLIFLAVMALLASTFGAVAWWLLAQDRQLATQRLVERQDVAADLVAATLDKRISAVQQGLDRLLVADDASSFRDLPGALLVRVEADVVRTWPDYGLVYSLIPPDAPEASDTLFMAADELEFGRRDYGAAQAELQELAVSSDARVRAAALSRLARNYRKSGRLEESLKAASQLADLGSVSVGGVPAALGGALIALYAVDRQEDRELLRASARKLHADLNSGRWTMSAAVYRSLSRELERWLPPSETAVARSAVLTSGVDWLWQERNRGRVAGLGRRVLATTSGPLLVQWKASEEAVAAFVADADHLRSEWLAEIAPRLEALDVAVSLTDLEGRAVLGATPGAAVRPAIRLAPDTGLPWTVQVSGAANEAATFAARRRLLLIGMGVLLLLILTGTWFIGNAISRELVVARLKADFVSTVSHEFRTPLTTLCQLSELLKRDRVATDEDRRQYYDLLHRESNRLRRLVESLLNFGRLEAGKLQFHFEPLDVTAFVRESAAAFVEAQQGHVPHFEVEVGAGAPPMVEADRETLQCALWNLFENAVKYSPRSDTVRVNVANAVDRVVIEVRDRGAGIPPDEQQRVFDKFVRGTAAREGNVRGTGIGLAMAREIVRAHGGDITVDSEYGKGSTFRIVLPAA